MTSLSTQLQWFVACFTCAYSLLQEHSSHLAAPTNCTNNAKVRQLISFAIALICFKPYTFAGYNGLMLHIVDLIGINID